ncbi:MAG: CarD family transcriptional regulator, partial [Chloroflexota bacterium]|nr:CarD family transcriptional regulator [Chloroflexota bacterium]
MGLSGILDIVEESPTYQRVLAELAGVTNGVGPFLVTVPDIARSYFIACLCRDLHRTVLLITARPEDAERLSDNLTTILGGEDSAETRDAYSILRLPESEFLPYERLAESPEIAHRRLHILSSLLRRRHHKPEVSANKRGSEPEQPTHVSQGIALVGSVAALSQRLLNPDEFEDATHILEVGQSIKTGPLLAQWASMGYILESTVEVPGTASRRGGILDVFPPSESLPFRIELFGDIIEDIRPFDPLTQRSSPTVPRVTITPALDRRSTTGLGGTQIADKAGLDNLLHQLGSVEQTTEPLQRIREDLKRLQDGETVDEANFYAGFLCDGSVTDYLPTDAVVVVVEPDRVIQEAIALETQAEGLRIAKVARKELPAGFPSPYWPWPQVEEHLNNHVARLNINWLTSSSSHPAAGGAFRPVPAPSFWGKLDAFATAVSQRAHDRSRVVVLSDHADRLQEVLEDYGVGAKVLANLGETPDVGTVSLVPSPLPEGMHLELPSGSLFVFTDTEIFGHAKRRRSLRKHAQRREAFLTELVPGTYVVHIDHGIGKFSGVRKVSGAHGSREYLTLEYAEGDKLYVPSEHMNRISPYLAPGDSSPTLTRLGSQEWAKAKDRARTSAKEMARELVALYAARQVLPGRAFSPDTVWQREMEDAFPHVETRDQLEAIEAIKGAMEAPHPMDHLICGDVGYGKTEIAIRAAFKAVQDGAQVALLCPTTILAQQHYTTFADRLSPYPVRIEVLSRFRTPQEQQETIKGLRNGRVDILIGTHRILQ